MTSENTLIGPDEPNINWAVLEDEVFGDATVQDTPAPTAPPARPEPRPEPEATAEAGQDEPKAEAVDEAKAEVEVDPEADAWLWPSTLDGKGRLTGETARPNPEAMRAALHRARSTAAADVDALAEAISEPEAREIIHTASQQRSYERELDAGLAKRRAELASEGARRQAEHEARMAESRRRRENRATAARERRDRALDPTSRIVRLAAAERWVPWIAVAPAVLAAVLGAVNVGVSLDVLSPHTQLINWMVEPLVTLPLIAILVAQILGAIGEGKANPYRNLERGLVAVALGLNVGLHIYIDGLVASAFVWAIVPAGLAISANLVPRLIRSLRQALAAASDESIREQHREQNRGAFRTAPAARPASTAPGAAAESTRTEPGPSQVSDESTPESRSGVQVLAELAEAVRDGRIDPGTGRTINPASAESIRRTIGVGKDRARALRDQFAQAAE